MRLNHHTDYALRLLMYLAQSPDRVTAERVADAYGISRNHLVKVANRLAELGHIETRRGRGGGLKLARKPEEINVGAVVRALESLDGFVDCFGETPRFCPVAGVCGLEGVLHVALGDFLARLDRYTLADMTPRPKMFRARVGLFVQTPTNAEIASPN